MPQGLRKSIDNRLVIRYKLMKARLSKTPKVDRKVWFHRVFVSKTQDEDEMYSDAKPLQRSF